MPPIVSKPIRKPATRKLLFEGLDATHTGIRARITWALLNGDALACLQTLPDGMADCAVTSPPYYWQRDYGVDGQSGQEDTVEAYVESVRTVFREVRRVLKPRGLLFLKLGDTYYSGKGQPVGGDSKQIWRNVSLEQYRAVDKP